MGVWHRKANIVAKQKPRAFGITFADDAITITDKDPMESEVVSENLSISELVYQIVSRSGPVEKAEMTERVAEYRSETADKVRASVATAISRHLKASRIVEIDNKLAIQARLEDEWTI